MLRLIKYLTLAGLVATSPGGQANSDDASVWELPPFVEPPQCQAVKVCDDSGCQWVMICD